MPSDRRLKRVVADLAGLHPDDRDSVLSLLPEPERRKVDRLLEAFLGFDTPAPETFDAAQLSPWLVERISLQQQGVTDATCNALRQLAVRCFPAPVAQPAKLRRQAKP
jgi:hypothetical protein